MKQSSVLLVKKEPLLILPQLAVIIGLNESIIVRQLDYWTLKAQNSGGKSGKFENGRWWTFQSYKEFHRQFPFWDKRTIKRLIQRLEEQEILLSHEDANDYYIGGTRKYYAINYDKLDEIAQACGLVPSEPRPSPQSNHQEGCDGMSPDLCQNDTTSGGEMSPDLCQDDTTFTESTTETTPETTTEIEGQNNSGAAAPPQAAPPLEGSSTIKKRKSRHGSESQETTTESAKNDDEGIVPDYALGLAIMKTSRAKALTARQDRLLRLEYDVFAPDGVTTFKANPIDLWETDAHYFQMYYKRLEVEFQNQLGDPKYSVARDKMVGALTKGYSGEKNSTKLTLQDYFNWREEQEAERAFEEKRHEYVTIPDEERDPITVAADRLARGGGTSADIKVLQDAGWKIDDNGHFID